MAAIIFVLFLVCLAAIASSRSRYWNAVLCRLWMIASVAWVAGVYYITEHDFGAVDWPLVLCPPPGVLMAFGVLHWAFSPRLPRDPMEVIGE